MVHRENAVMCFGIRKAQQPDSFSEKGDNIGKDRKSWMENKITGGAVSYTHLDVYKRQSIVFNYE